MAAAEIVGMLIRLQSGEPGNRREETLHVTNEIIPRLEREQAHGELARAWVLVASMEQSAGRFSTTGDAITKVIEHARQAGEDRLVSRSAMGLSVCALLGPTPVKQAIEQCELLISEGLSDRQALGLVMCNAAQLRAMNAEFDAARTLYREGRSLLEALAQGVDVACSSMSLAGIELLAGTPGAAEAEVRSDYAMLEALGETYYLSTLAPLLARILSEQGRNDEALALTKKAEILAAEDDVDAQIRWRLVRAPILARAGGNMRPLKPCLALRSTWHARPRCRFCTPMR